MYRNQRFAFFLRSQCDIPESDRYGLIGLVLGLKNRDLSLTTENLLKVEKPGIAFTCVLLDVRLKFVFFASQLQLGFLEDATQVDILVPRLRKALKNATGGTNKASELSFSQLQIELDTISRDNLLKVSEHLYYTYATKLTVPNLILFFIFSYHTTFAKVQNPSIHHHNNSQPDHLGRVCSGGGSEFPAN